MKPNKFSIIIILIFSTLSISAVERDTIPGTGFPVVNGGLKLQANASNFLMKNIPTMPDLHSTMNAAGEIGGFIDFNIGKHFLINFNLMIFAAQNDLHNTHATDKMWTVGLEIPMYLLGRYGSENKGYIYFGGGPFTQFAIYGQLLGSNQGRNPYKHIIQTEDIEEETYALSDNCSGLGAYLGYELPCRVQFNASYHIGLSDLLLFEHEKGTYTTTQKVTLGIAYRFK